MSKEKYGFVYIWRDRKQNRYYVGCHWGTVDDGYVCSSNWMRDVYKRRPEDFHRRILINNIKDRSQIYIEEQKVFSMIRQEELRTRYYNLRLDTVTTPWHMDPSKSLTIGQRISAAKKGKPTGPRSPETAAKISAAKKGKSLTVEHKKALSDSQRGKVLSEEHKQIISVGLKEHYENHDSKNLGRKLTEEHKSSISKKLKGKPKTSYTKSDASRDARLKSQQLASAALKGAKAYNNGEIEKRCKEHPGEGWMLGGLKRS